MKKQWEKALGVFVSFVMVTSLVPVSALAAQGDESAGGEVPVPELILTTQDGDEDLPGANAVAMTLDEPCDVTVAEDGYWVGKFTAPEAGTYIFYSSGDYDTVGYLYSSPSLDGDDELADNDDGGEVYNFSIAYALSANQTVYLKAYGLSAGAIDFTATVTKLDDSDLESGLWEVYWNGSGRIIYTGTPIVNPGIIVRRWDDGTDDYLTLEQDKDYKLSYYENADGEQLESAPADCGNYTAVYEGMGSYHGTVRMQFDVFDLFNLGDPCWNVKTPEEYGYHWWSEEDTEQIELSNGALVMPDIDFVCFSIGEDGEDVYLTKGTDYELKGYLDANKNELEAAPSTPGLYYVVYAGKGDYHGSKVLPFRALGDRFDLTYATIKLYDTLYYWSGNPVRLDVDGVHDTNNGWLYEDEDFVFVYYDNKGEKLPSAPSDTGDYFVAVGPAAGTDYTNESAKVAFSILGQNDLRNSNRFYASFPNRSVIIFTGEAVKLPSVRIYDDYDDTQLTAGTDYVFSHYEDSNEVVLEDAPSGIGDYYAVYDGNGDYSGSIKAHFSICSATDLTYADITVDDDMVLLGDDGIARPTVTVTDAAGKVLVAGDDYALAFIDNNDNPIASPNKTGYFCVRAVTGNSGVYTGKSSWYEFEVYDPHALNIASIELVDSSIPLVNGVATPEVTVTDASGKILSEGTDYVLKYYDNDGNPIEVPNTQGYYYVYAVPGSNNAYKESTGQRGFTVYDPYDIGDDEAWNGEFWPSSYIPTSATSLPMPLIYSYDNEDDTRVRLTEGTDFQLARITNGNGDDLGKSIPAVPGDYFAVYEGIGEGGYHGTCAIAFTVYDKNSIGGAYWTGSFKGGNVFYTDGAPVELTEALIYNAENKERLVQGTDFEFVRFEDSDGTNLGTVAPSKEDWYYAVYQGIGAYKNSMRKIGFQVRNSYNLFRARITLDKSTYQYISEPITLLAKVYDSDGIKLAEGTDYEFVYYKNGQKLDGPPTSSGEYYVKAKAKEGGAYTGESDSVYFTISAGAVGPVGPTDSVNLSLDTDFDATVANDQYWLGKFTATEAGAYVFYSKGHDDTYGTLYGDAALSEELNRDDDDGDGSNFRIIEPLAAGQTVYLQSRGYSWRAAECAVRVEKVNAYDLANASVKLKKYTVALVGETAAPEVTVVDVLDNTLKEGTDYELKYWYSDWNGYQPIEGAPAKTGDYYVKATHRDGGSYIGESYESYFTVVDGRDLSTATIKLAEEDVVYTGNPVKPTVTVTAASGATLIEGVDYELVFYQSIYGAYERIASAPSEAGANCCVAALAKAGGKYTGRTEREYFTIVDPTDVTTNWDVFMNTPAYYDNVGYASIPVYLFSGTAVEPGFYVWSDRDDETIASTNYTVAYSNNDKASTGTSPATLTVTGKSPNYKNSITKEFELVETLDLANYARYQSCRLVAGSESLYYSPNNSTKPQFLADGGAIMPSVVFTSGSAANTPVQGRDFTVSYVDSTGTAVAEPTNPGKYQIVLTATATGLCTGTGKVPFVITPTRDLGAMGARPYPASTGSLSYDYDHDDDGVTIYSFDELFSNVQGLIWYLSYNGETLIENLDYELTTDSSGASNIATYFFTGEGGYEGTVKVKMRGAATAAESFASRSVYVGRSGEGIVYVDESGKPQTPVVGIDGLTEGIDFTYGGLVNEAGAALATAKPGDVAFVKFVGAGAYAGCERKVGVGISQGTAAIDIASRQVDFSLANGAVSYDENGNAQWYLLKSAAPSVTLTIYGRNSISLDEGNGFTVSQTTSGNTLKLTLTATEGAPIAGSVTKNVTLVDSYPLNTMVRRVVLRGVGGDYSAFTVGSGTSASLSYKGVSYMPTASFVAENVLDPQVSLTLKNASGTKVDAISSAGKYTLVASGTGSWSGTVEVPIEVTASTDRIRLATCDLTVGTNTALADGAAKPTVTLSTAGYTLKEGTDYTLEYGSNTVAGARGWVKATAVKGGKFTGTAKANFTVGGEGKALSKASYELRLQRPSGEGFVSSSPTRVYSINGGTAVKPAVQVVYRDASGNATTLDSKYYTVEYGNVSQPGTAYVKVTGQNGYTGSLAANYLLIAGNSKKSQVITAEDKDIKVGATASLDAKTSGDGALSYVSSDETVATVSSTGVVTGKKAGEATITITAAETKDYAKATKTVTVTVEKYEQTVTASDKDAKVGKTVEIGATTDGDGKLSYESLNPAVATVDANGTVAGISAGTATITITAAETDRYAQAIKGVTVTVEKSPQTITAWDKTVQVDKTVALDATTDGDGTLSYVSSNEAVATVDSTGTVTGIAEGMVEITISASETAACLPASKTVIVSVSTKQLQKIEGSDLTLKAGETKALGAVRTLGDGALTYASSNEAIATVSASGEVTGVSAGQAQISVTAAETAGWARTTEAFTVTVERNAQTITASGKNVSIGGTVALGATTDGNGALSYESLNPAIATVDANGTVTGVFAGTATITIKAAQTGTHEQATKDVTVTVGKNAQTITVASPSQTVKTGASVAIGATTDGDGALTFESSDTTIATVDASGTVTGKKAGTAMITITAAETDGFQKAVATVTVTVKKAQTITAKDKVVQVKKTVKLAAKTSGNGALTYKTSNAKVATVDAKGVVTGKKAGTAKITITAAETAGYMKATKTVTVTVKKANTLVITTATRQLSLNTLKTKGQAFKPDVVKKKGKGTLTYAKKSVTSKYKKYVTVAKNGTVTVKKGAPKGKCVLNLNVNAAGNASYMPVTKTAKVTITIK